LLAPFASFAKRIVGRPIRHSELMELKNFGPPKSRFDTK
jgi:hypothetical protein